MLGVSMKNHILIIIDKQFCHDLTGEFVTISDPQSLNTSLIIQQFVTLLKTKSRDTAHKRISIAGLETRAFTVAPVQVFEAGPEKFFLYFTNFTSEAVHSGLKDQLIKQMSAQQSTLFPSWQDKLAEINQLRDDFMRYQGITLVLKIAKDVYFSLHPQASEHKHGKERVEKLMAILDSSQAYPLKELADFCQGEGAHKRSISPLPFLSSISYKAGHQPNSYIPVLLAVLKNPDQYTLISEEDKSMVKKVASWLEEQGFDIQQKPPATADQQHEYLFEAFQQWLITQRQHYQQKSASLLPSAF
ncbi:MAG: hypothetical protein K0S08_1317 [Gammaproteobacteria bacterium]|jgi:hypothetical protein|nr:hypothetical protein [Gammaproteobacteria bacterium]